MTRVPGHNLFKEPCQQFPATTPAFAGFIEILKKLDPNRSSMSIRFQSLRNNDGIPAGISRQT